MPFLDISSKVLSGGEQGLLSVAFHPQYSSNGRFFVNYTAIGVGAPYKSVIAEYHVSTTNLDVADTSERVLLEIPDLYTNHNGGQNLFGPDGYLYIGLGDEGGAGDPQNNGQNLGTLFGKVLRIDVNGALPYAIPSDNPFLGPAARAGGAGPPGRAVPGAAHSHEPAGRRVAAKDDRVRGEASDPPS